MTIVILKTSAETLPGVLRHQKHALQGNPRRLVRGDVILVAQTYQPGHPTQARIRYRMDFIRAYHDNNNESDQLFGRHFEYVIEGASRTAIRPFNIADVQVTAKDYGHGGTIVYLEPADEDVLRRKGYLEPFGH